MASLHRERQEFEAAQHTLTEAIEKRSDELLEYQRSVALLGENIEEKNEKIRALEERVIVIEEERKKIGDMKDLFLLFV